MLFDPDAPFELKSRQRRARSPWMPLLSAVLELASGQAGLLRHAERCWASTTFTGTKHTVTLVFTGIEAQAAAEHFVERLGEHEFAIPGQLVADASVVGVEQEMLPEPRFTVEAELLLLDEC